MHQMRRSFFIDVVVSVVESIYFEKVKNNMTHKRKRESLVCFSPGSSKIYFETSKW